MPTTNKKMPEAAAQSALTEANTGVPEPAKKSRAKATDATLSSPQALNQAVWAICDVLRSAGVGSATRYVPELTWILFLRVLDEQEAQERDEAEALGLPYTATLSAPWRWQDWAAPYEDKPESPATPEGLRHG